jgi:hypothetical protein
MVFVYNQGMGGEMSKLENCPTCGNKTSENAETCPACGEPLAKGWAAEIERVREQERMESKRQQRELEKNERKVTRKKWVIAAATIAIVVGGLTAKNKYDDYYESNLKEADPVAFKKLISELEAKVAKVPASNFNENIRLYRKLQRIDQNKKLYQDKITHYQKRKKAAVLEAKKVAAEAEKRKKEIERIAKLEEKRRGFHCLLSRTSWHFGVKNYVKNKMRNPDSFEHIKTVISPVNAKGAHALIMKYRAQNGFGGMSVGVALATINNADCSAKIISIK